MIIIPATDKINTMPKDEGIKLIAVLSAIGFIFVLGIALVYQVAIV